MKNKKMIKKISAKSGINKHLIHNSLFIILIYFGIFGLAQSSQAAAWRDIWSPPSQIASGEVFSTNVYSSGTDVNMRVWSKNAYFNGTINRVRIRLLGGASPGLYKAMSICEKATSGNPWDCATTPTPVTFSSSASVTVGANQTIYSDEITGFTMVSGKDYLFNYWVNTGTTLTGYKGLKNSWQRLATTQSWWALNLGNQTSIATPSGTYWENDGGTGYWFIQGIDGIQGYTDAQTLAAVDADYSSVQPLLDKAADGDTISVPYDSKTLNWSLVIWRNLTLKGADPNNRTVYSCVQNCVTMDTNRPNPRITGFNFSGGANQQPLLLVQQSPTGFRIDNNALTNAAYLPMWIGNDVTNWRPYGLVDNNTFTDIKHSVVWQSGFPSSWDDPDNYGNLPDAIKQVFFENNTWTASVQYVLAAGAPVATDGRNGSRFVFRYNNLTNYGTHSHGPGQGWTYDGFASAPRQQEMYNNLFVYDGITIYAPFYTGGGILIAHENKIKTINAGWVNSGPFEFRNYRGDVPTGYGNDTCDTLAGCYGGNIRDGNYDFASGTATCGAGNTCSSMVVTITPALVTGREDYYKGYRIFNTSDPGSSCKITGNTLTTVTCDGLTGGSSNTWSNGNSFAIRSGWPCIGQIGQGRRTCIAGAAGCPTKDVYEWFPARIWANDRSECTTGTGCTDPDPVESPPTPDPACLTTAPHIAGNGYRLTYYGVANGDDYISCNDSSCALPGYVPFTCPHPLAGLTGSCNSNIAGRAGYNVGASQDTTPPAAPTGLGVN